METNKNYTIKVVNSIGADSNACILHKVIHSTFKSIFDFTTAGDWDCVAAVGRLLALHYSVDFSFLSYWVMGFIMEL